MLNIAVFLATIEMEEWEVEISPSSRYYTEGELVGGESRRRSTRPRADLWGPSDRSNPFIRHHLGQVSICFPILYPVLRIPIRKFAGRSGSGSH